MLTTDQKRLPTLGRYELLHEIARGGMAVLYLAREVGIEGFEKVVVVKRIRPELRGRPEYLTSFLDEAVIAAALQHANLPHVYELGCVDGEHYFAMEYLHGADVQRIMRAIAAEHRELPLEHAISIGLGLCAGLHHAHEKRAADGAPMNLVHRDVSPKNVFVTYDGGVKLLDFGIAKAEQKRGETSTGTLKGTLHYLSPEQIRRLQVDRRADIFAAAILLWEVTTGRRLFTGVTEYEVMRRILEDDAPAPSTVRADYPPELERIVMKGLRRAPEDRFQTAEELQLALERFAREQRLATSPIGLARFMRENFGAEVSAYQTAKEHGTLVSCALEEVSTWKQESSDDEGASPLPPSPSSSSSSRELPKATRPLVYGAAAPRSALRWISVAAVVGVIAVAIAWLSRGGSESVPRPVAPPTANVSAPPANVSAAPPVPDTTATAPTPSPAPTPAPQQEHHEVKRAAEKQRVPTPRVAKSKPLTLDDLDAVLPPKGSAARGR